MNKDNIFGDIEPGEKLFYGFIGIMQEKGPVTHTELCNEMQCGWYEAQGVIQELWAKGLVRFKIDRKYELTEQGEEV